MVEYMVEQTTDGGKTTLVRLQQKIYQINLAIARKLYNASLRELLNSLRKVLAAHHQGRRVEQPDRTNSNVKQTHPSLMELDEAMRNLRRELNMVHIPRRIRERLLASIALGIRCFRADEVD